MNNENGLIFGYILDGRGGGAEIDWDRVAEWTPNQGTLWLHLDYNSEQVQNWLRTKSKLSQISCELLLEEDTRPRVVSSEDGLFLILRGVNCNPGSDPEDMVALRTCFSEDRIITMRHRRVMAIDDIHKAIVDGRGPTSSGDFLVATTERIADRMGDKAAMHQSASIYRTPTGCSYPIAE
jgi:zinc transporter